MTLLTQTAVDELLRLSDRPTVSIYLPTHRVIDRFAPQDPIRFRNLLSRGKRDLMAAGLRRPEAAEVLAPAHALLQDAEFWEHRDEGLAVFAADQLFRHYRLGFAPPEMVTVARRPYVKPLLQILSEAGRFYLLVLEDGSAALCQGDREQLRRLDEPAISAIGADLWSVPAPGQLSDDHASRVHDVCRALARVVQRLVMDEGVPLLLGGEPALVAAYRSVSTEPYLAPEALAPLPSGEPQSWHDRAWASVAPHFKSSRRDVRDRFAHLLGTGCDLVSTDPLSVITASREGRVDTLFLAANRQVWGMVDAGGAPNLLPGGPERGAEDLLNLAAVESLRHGGTVLAVEPGDVPGGGPVAALYRYPLKPGQQAIGAGG